MHCSKPVLYMAFDFGLKRTGVAFGNAITKTAQGIAVIDAIEEKQRFATIGMLIREWQPECLVVGVPHQPDGEPTELTVRCERFARQLEGRFALPCALVDERYTSAVVEHAIAKHYMGGKTARHDKGRIDMGSACLILEQFFLEGR